MSEGAQRLEVRRAGSLAGRHYYHEVFRKTLSLYIGRLPGQMGMLSLSMYL